MGLEKFPGVFFVVVIKGINYSWPSLPPFHPPLNADMMPGAAATIPQPGGKGKGEHKAPALISLSESMPELTSRFLII